jgi:hypothetical protein
MVSPPPTCWHQTSAAPGAAGLHRTQQRLQGHTSAACQKKNKKKRKKGKRKKKRPQCQLDSVSLSSNVSTAAIMAVQQQEAPPAGISGCSTATQHLLMGVGSTGQRQLMDP